MKRVILIVLDSVGAGALPDAVRFNDAGANTLGHINSLAGLKVPNMRKMGLGYIPGIGMEGLPRAIGAVGRAAEKSLGKDTTTGHWEIAGLISERPFPLYPDGFPDDIIDKYEKAIGRRILGNKPAIGDQHQSTGMKRGIDSSRGVGEDHRTDAQLMHDANRKYDIAYRMPFIKMKSSAHQNDAFSVQTHRNEFSGMTGYGGPGKARNIGIGKLLQICLTLKMGCVTAKAAAEGDHYIRTAKPIPDKICEGSDAFIFTH